MAQADSPTQNVLIIQPAPALGRGLLNGRAMGQLCSYRSAYTGKAVQTQLRVSSALVSVCQGRQKTAEAVTVTAMDRRAVTVLAAQREGPSKSRSLGPVTDSPGL